MKTEYYKIALKTPVIVRLRAGRSIPGRSLGRFCLWTARGLTHNEMQEDVDMGGKLAFIDRLIKSILKPLSVRCPMKDVPLQILDLQKEISALSKKTFEKLD